MQFALSFCNKLTQLYSGKNIYSCFQFQENQENLERDDKEVLSPRRLHPGRFSQLTKSSYIPEAAVKEGPSRQQSRDGKIKSSYQYNGIDKFEKENSFRSVESSNYVSNERTRNGEEKYHTSYDPLEPLRKNRNVDRVKSFTCLFSVMVWHA